MSHTRRFVWNVAVSGGYQDFMQQVRRRIASRVQSRTPGSNGQPVHREISLTEGNASLAETWRVIRTHDLNLRNVLVQAVFHYSNGRVERIIFSANHLRPAHVREPGPDPDDSPGIRRPRPTRPRSPRPSAPQPGPRPNRAEESTGEYVGIPGIPSYGRYFYGVHNTRHSTICWIKYDNETDTCVGLETDNEFALYLHYDRGRRDYLITCQQNRMVVSIPRYRNGANPNAPVEDIIYRQGVLDMRRELGHTAPLPF